MSALETLTLRPTVIAGRRYVDDYSVIWRGTCSAAAHRTTGRSRHGRVTCPAGRRGSDDRGNVADFVDAKAKFKEAWVGIRAGLTGQDIADAR